MSMCQLNTGRLASCRRDNCGGYLVLSLLRRRGGRLPLCTCNLPPGGCLHLQRRRGLLCLDGGTLRRLHLLLRLCTAPRF